MRKVIKALMIGAIALLLLCLTPYNVGAAGLGVAPTEIHLDDVLRGSEVLRSIRVFNIGEETVSFRLTASGEAAEWISFCDPDDPATTVETVIVPGNGKAEVWVKFKIPEDAADGIYTATIYVESTPSEEAELTGEGEAAQSVALQMPSRVTIEVTGSQILTGNVRGISAVDVEVNYPLRITVEFKNTGNVVATPQIDVEITKDAEAIGSFSSAEAKVKVANSEIISVEWDTTGKELGDYLARAAVSLGGEVIATDELNFTILPVGTLTREGVLTELALEGNLKLGTITKVQATFFNTGQIDTKAKFIGEVYCDNELVDALESEETLIPVGQKDTLASYLKLERPGNYDIKGYINYEGKKTEVKEISFTLAEASGEASQGRSFNLFSPIAIAVIVVLIAVIAFVALRRRRKAA